MSADEELSLIHAVDEFVGDPCSSIPLTSEDVAKATADDDVLSKVLRYLRDGWLFPVEESLKPFYRIRDELSIECGCLLWGMRVAIPVVFRRSLLRELHSCHFGASRMKSVARGFFWWPGMDAAIVEMCQCCELCQSHAKRPEKEPTHQWIYPSKPFERIHVDFAEFDHRMYLLIVDAYSKWLEVFEMGRDCTSSRTVSSLLQVISRFGIPQILVSDNGPQFVSKEFELFCQQNGIIHKRSPPYHPASNGQVERLVQELKKALRTREPGVPVPTQLQRFLFAYRNTPHSSTHESPSQLLFKNPPVTRFSFLKPSFSSAMKSRQDTGVTPNRSFAAGQDVWLLNPAQHGSKWLKAVIVSRLGPLSYSVECQGRNRHVHVEHLRFRSSAGDDPDQGLVSAPLSTQPVTLPSGASTDPTELTPSLIETRATHADSDNNAVASPTVIVPAVTASELQSSSVVPCNTPIADSSVVSSPAKSKRSAWPHKPNRRLIEEM